MNRIIKVFIFILSGFTSAVLAENDSEIYQHAVEMTRNTETELEGLQTIYRLAENGYAEAQIHLAVSYLHYKKSEEAIYWYQKAAELGETSAIFDLGRLYYDGTRIPKDCRKAEKWFKLGADKRDEGSIIFLSSLYDPSEGCSKKPSLSYAYLKLFFDVSGHKDEKLLSEKAKHLDPKDLQKSNDLYLSLKSNISR